jgi:hypothetical protein
MRRPLTWISVPLAAVLFAGGCASENKPQVCDSYAAVQTTVDHIRDVNVSENGLTALQPYLTQLGTELNRFSADAKAQFAPQTDPVKAALDQLGSALRTAQADPSATTFAAVRTAVASVRSTWQTLHTTMSQTC